MSKTKNKKSTGPIDEHIGKRIQVRRKLLGMTQKSFEATIGLSYQQLHKYETARNRVPAARLYEIADALGVPIAYFFMDNQGNQIPVADF